MTDKGSRKADLWQRKYYQSLDELEQKEKQWQELESLLRLLASRLTLLSDASDETLETKLDKLRSNLRYEDDTLKFRPLINDISSAIASSNSRIKVKKNSDEVQFSRSMASLLDEFKIPTILRRQEKHVRKRIEQAKSEKDIAELIKDIAELLDLTIEYRLEEKRDEVGTTASDELPEQKIEIKPESPSGLLKKLFSATKRKSEDASESQKIEEQKDLAGTDAIAVNRPADLPVDISIDTGVDTEQDTVDESVTLLSAEAIHYVAEILIQLLERLELPRDLSVEAGLICQRLETCVEQKNLLQGIEKTASLVAEAHSRILGEKKELEVFLQQLTERLQEIDTDLQETARLQQLSITGSREVNAAVEKEVRGIEQSVDKASDLTMLQTDIQSRVIIIRDHMDSFLQAELLRDRQSGDISERLKKELTEAEQKIEILRKQLENEREQAMKDGLTGLFNRRAYDQYIKDELARFKRYASPFVLAVWDVDRFKTVNDQYGHAAGDKVLKIIADIIAENIRETDIVARYGGEEFVIIMPETKIEAAYTSLEKLNRMIKNCGFHFRGERVEVTASCGITESRPDDTPESIFQRADKALYQAKEMGRNRCLMAE
ncbi:diguanylate cyclase (GGDEF domain) [hydrothermal vent metagenome]|uniref:Diguanylate cyclase (GGDEF domain) n=1 Tax=hydrothermal vent metagenome TaxID=652676 RepID=A0A3B1BS39_9ZZZZ